MKKIPDVLKKQFLKKKRNVLYVCFFILLLYMGSACSNKEQNAAPLAANSTVDSFLDVLYLTNFPDSPQIQNLDSLIDSTSKYKKLVFQFLHTNSGKFTLGAWASKSKNQDFNTTDVQILQNSKPSDIRINNLSAYFGDLQINNKTWDSAFDTIINKPNARYIIFSPAIKDNHVIYKITIASSISDMIDLTTTVAELNPSPPRSAD